MKGTGISRRRLFKAGLGTVTLSFTSASAVALAHTADAAEGHDSASVANDVKRVQDLGSFPPKKPIDYVNVLFGTASLDDPKLIGNAPPPGEELYTGMVCPGATLPHATTDVGPVNKDTSLAYPHGNLYPYVYPRRTMVGSSNMVPDLVLMPLVGDWTTPPDRIRYASLYCKESEKSSPGYYTVYLADHKIRVELTATMWTALYRFRFPKTDRATILLDLGPNASSNLEILGNQKVRGQAGGTKVFFVAELSRPFKSFGSFWRDPPGAEANFWWSLLGTDTVQYDSRSASGTYAGCYLNYAASGGEEVLVRVAAGDSFEQAERRLKAEIFLWDFDAMRKRAEETWNKQLSLIEVKGGTEKERSIFYSALYHAFASPRLVAEKGEEFIGEDSHPHVADYDRYDSVPFWDTGRNQVVLLTLLEPNLKLDVLRSHLEMARETGWMHTAFHGDHAVAMYLGDWQRGLKFDWEAVYEYLRKNAVDPRGPRAKLAPYLKRGWIPDAVVEHPGPPYEGGDAGVSKTLEYCYDDYCLATYARKLGKEDDYRMFMERASNYKNVWDPSTGFMRGRKEDGSWIEPFDPREPQYNFMYKEASGWQMVWFVPHDVQGLINLTGGREEFVKRLDQFFSLPYNPKGIARDVTGMIGQYCHGDEPDHQAPYLYNWAGAPWKTQEVVRRILRRMYGSDKDGLGLSGMDDDGENCSWYVLSAMGFYTVDPARPEYIIGSPIFDEVTLHLADDKDFVIVANDNSERNIYVQSALLNGKPLDNPWFQHSDIANGGKLILNVGHVPSKTWGSAPESAPPSMSS